MTHDIDSHLLHLANDACPFHSQKLDLATIKRPSCYVVLTHIRRSTMLHIYTIPHVANDCLELVKSIVYRPCECSFIRHSGSISCRQTSGSSWLSPNILHPASHLADRVALNIDSRLEASIADQRPRKVRSDAPRWSADWRCGMRR
jgi:hypothetical protein